MMSYAELLFNTFGKTLNFSLYSAHLIQTDLLKWVNWICNLGNLSPTRAICTGASQKMTCFLLFDKLCDYTVQNLVVGSSNSDDGTYKTDKERSALKLKII